MSWLTILKIVGPLALAGLLAWGFNDWRGLRTDAKAAAQCVKAAGDPTADASICAPGLATSIIAKRMNDQCNAALEAKPRQEFTLRASCSGATKRLFAELIVSNGDLEDARSQLARSATDMISAVQRAEARAITQTTRKAANDATLAAAPRAADGRVRCDAECLRALSAATPGR